MSGPAGRTGVARRIRAELEGHIRSGAWPPGHRLPTEQALAAQYGCARMTVSQAVGALAAAGLVERNKKAGSVVARPHVQTAVLAIPDLEALITGQGAVYAFRLLRRRVRRPRPADADEAGLAAPGEVLALRGLHLADGRPFALEHRVINLAAVPAARVVDFGEQAPGAWLVAHVPWTLARHRIAAVGADVSVAGPLELGAGTACLQVDRWTYRLGAGVTFVRQTFPGDRYDLVADFEPRR